MAVEGQYHRDGVSLEGEEEQYHHLIQAEAEVGYHPLIQAEVVVGYFHLLLVVVEGYLYLPQLCRLQDKVSGWHQVL